MTLSIKRSLLSLLSVIQLPLTVPAENGLQSPNDSPAIAAVRQQGLQTQDTSIKSAADKAQALKTFPAKPVESTGIKSRALVQSQSLPAGAIVNSDSTINSVPLSVPDTGFRNRDNDSLLLPVPGIGSGADSAAENLKLGHGDTGTVKQDSSQAASPAPPAAAKTRFCAVLGGNLPRQIEANSEPYLVNSDIYVPSGKTVVIKPGAVFLFKNFTEFHIEGRLIAEGTRERPIIFTSEFDRAWNPDTKLIANPYDWNGIYIHEGGIGSSFAFCQLHYTVYGINSLTRYIKINQVMFRNNGRSDLMIEGKKRTVSSDSYFYALTISDAKKDGVPVAVLMDPMGKKRSMVRYGGLSLTLGGLTGAVVGLVMLSNDQKKLDALSEIKVVDDTSPIVAKSAKDWDQAYGNRNRDRLITIAGVISALLGGAGFGWSFTF